MSPLHVHRYGRANPIQAVDADRAARATGVGTGIGQAPPMVFATSGIDDLKEVLLGLRDTFSHEGQQDPVFVLSRAEEGAAVTPAA